MTCPTRRSPLAARRFLLAPAGAVLLAIGGCSPTLDWREIRPEGSSLTLLFPCKPANHAREVRLDGKPRPMTLHACEAGGITFALGQVSVSDAREVGPALEALRDAAVANLQASAPSARSFGVPGGASAAGVGRLDASGRLPGGDAAQLAAVFFFRGTQLFQATAFGQQLDPEAVDTYFSSLKISG